MESIENKVKIISLTTTYPESPESTKPKFVHSLNKELVRNGFRIIVNCPHSINNPKNFEMDSVKVKFFRYLPQNLQINANSIPDEIKSNFGKIKFLFMISAFFISTLRLCFHEKNFILHGHWAFPSGYIAYLVSKIYKKKFIVTIHGSEIPLLKKFNFLQKIVISCLNKSSNVITSSEYLKQNLIKMGLNKEKIILIKPIPNFYSHDLSPEKINEFRNKFTSSNNKIILFVGRLTEVKGVEFLIKAFSKLSIENIHLIIVGDGVLLNKLKEMAKSLKIDSKVTFFGSATSQQVSMFYDISDVFVMPSIETSDGSAEGMGLVIPEAMKYGLPIISTNVGGIKDFVKNEQNGIIISPKNPSEIALSIENILSNDILRKKIIENSKNTLKEFSPQTLSKKYVDVINNIAVN